MVLSFTMQFVTIRFVRVNESRIIIQEALIKWGCRLASEFFDAHPCRFRRLTGCRSRNLQGMSGVNGTARCVAEWISDCLIHNYRTTEHPTSHNKTYGNTAQYGGTSDGAFSAIRILQISWLTANKPAKFAGASGESAAKLPAKFTRQLTALIVRYCLM